MSAGELESEWAGAPGRLIRDRYRRAAEVAKVRGRLPCLMINDLDAGVGIQEGVQRTVRGLTTIAQRLLNLPLPLLWPPPDRALTGAAAPLTLSYLQLSHVISHCPLLFVPHPNTNARNCTPGSGER